MVDVRGAPIWRTEGFDLAGLLAPAPWHRDAACVEYPGDWWFPERGGNAKAATAQAKAVCARCLVRDDCLEWALGVTETDDYGIWGGTTQPERRRIRRERRSRAA